MTAYKLMVLSNAADGADEDFDRWYDQIHLGDVLKLGEITKAQRFRERVILAGTPAYRFCTIYDVETDNPEGTIKRLEEAAGTDEMPLSESMNPDFYAVLYETLGPLRHA